MTKFVKSFLIFFTSGQILAASHHPEQFLNSIKGKKNEGAQIVQQFCATCHSVKPMIELGAPKIAVVEDWQPRLLKGLSVLFQHTAEGFGAMPARGGCFECSDEQLQLAIDALLPKKNKKVLK